MASQIQVQSFNQFLGAMIRTIIANTPLSDVNQGSVLLTILEAAAANDFENSAAILGLLNLLNISTVSNTDLDNRAADFGLTREPATKASGVVSVFNSAITKQSTSLYVLKPAPISGQTVLFVNNTTGWTPTGSIYIGRNTPQFEGPIAYSSFTVFATYSQVNLTTALQNNHLISDIVVNSQGQPDNSIPAGTVVKIPANNQNPEIDYVTLRDAVLPSGETEVDNIQCLALIAGSIGNAPVKSISQFNAIPFTGATISNPSAFTGGTDVETDQALRNRIIDYPNTLARGTEAAIIAAVIGLSDPSDNQQVVSAVIAESPALGQPAILYVDDGTGFQPSYAGQSVDTLLTNASGKEQFLQLANYPVTRAQIINTGTGPFVLQNGSYLNVAVDGTTETITFHTTDFVNISAATVAEIVVAINNQAANFSARLTNQSTNILLYPQAFDAEIIQVIPLQTTDNPLLFANTQLQFPTSQFSFISLFQNSNRLHEKAKDATVQTVAFASWNITSTGDLIISVDGTPEQDRSFGLNNFPGASSFATLTLDDWVTAFNQQFAGITAVATANQTMQISSNQSGSNSSIAVIGGSYLAQLFPTQVTSAVGQTSQFILNRQTGNLEILTDIEPGDNITAGIVDAKGSATSKATSSGQYNVSTDAFGRPATLVIVADSTYCNARSVSAVVSSTLAITNPSTNVMRIMSSTLTALAGLLPGDFLFLAQRTAGWLSVNNTGLFKIVDKGGHTTAGVDTYVDVLSPNITVQTVSVSDPADVQAFSTDGYPQVWLGSFTPTPAAALITDVVNSINTNLINVLASVYQSDAVKVTSTTELNGSIAIPVVSGNALSVFTATASANFGNPPEVANLVSSKTLLSYFKPAHPSLLNTFLGRQTYDDSKGALTADAIPDSPPYSGPYSETLTSSGVLNLSYVDYDSIISFTRGNNRDQLRSITALLGGDQAGTQEALARTALGHTTGDEFEILKGMELSASDSIVVVMDNNPQDNTITVNMARTGQVNSGNGTEAGYIGGDATTGTFIPTSTEFSANDFDNEPGIDFGNSNVWGTVINSTDFNDYAVWSRARNWYASGGVGSGLGAMITRAMEYGPNGNFLRFSMQYPTVPLQPATTKLNNTPSFSTFSYYFGSGAGRAIALSGGNTIAVKGPYPDPSTNFPNGVVSSGNYYDYTFSAGNFAPVLVGDILSITAASGVSTPNEGQFGIKNKSSNTVRVFNPTASVTTPGSQQVTTVTATSADILGTPTVYHVSTVADSAGSLDGKYFTVQDTGGIVALWINETGTTAQPFVAGAYRYIMIGTILSGDSANTVATKITNIINQDRALTAGVAANVITVTNIQNGNLGSGSNGTSGFTVTTFASGTNNSSYAGKYLIIHDQNGSVSVWFDVGNQGINEPFDGANRGIRVSSFNAGASANTVASAIQQAVNADSAFTASVIGNVVTINNNVDGNLSGGTPPIGVGTLGAFVTVSTVNGSLPAPESISNPAGITIFPLTGTSTLNISTTMNASTVMSATPVGSSSLTITVSTAEESYTYAGNATALAYGHVPTNLTTHGYTSMYDGANWVKTFENSNPNFILKTAFTLQAVSSIYSMDTAPNFDAGVGPGELIKLIPVTVQNLYHHFTQKALSQLPIVSSILISDDRKNVQIKSKQLGSAGAVQFVGGTGNQSELFIQSDSQVETDGSGSYLVVSTPAFPDTFSQGDTILLQNPLGVQRLSRLVSSDHIDVLNPSTGVFEYVYDAKALGINSSSAFTIVDVSASYSLPAGYVWRWHTTDVGVDFATVNPGDLLYAFGSLSGWNQNNQARPSGDAQVSGLPIIAVNAGSNYVDVSNPFGIAMSSTTVGSGTVQICPSPSIQWTLTHANYIALTSLVSNGTTVSVIASAQTYFNVGDNFTIRDSINVPDGIYAVASITGPNTFTFLYSSAPFTENTTHSSVIKSSSTPTRYRLQSLGFNGMVRLSANSGQSPNFLSCGVAVDDYMSISGKTFSSNNNGLFRVLAVDNNSVVFINEQATDQLNTIRLMNNQGIEVVFTSNTNTITGVAGAFKYVAVGDWVKKQTDPDTNYLQVLSLNASPTSATQITLGGNYLGTTDTSVGVFYNEAVDYDQGVFLSAASDISISEGDSVTAGDTLNVQNIVNVNWFNINNTGVFTVAQYGTEPSTFRPFLRVINTSGIAQSGVDMSVNTSGLYLVENFANKFYSIREVTHTVIDSVSTSLRDIFISPYSRDYKFTLSNNSSVTHLGKLGYSNDTVVGIDGYTYYTGLMQKVQRTVDGFEPDASTFPGQRAVGSGIEGLPPLPFNVNLALSIITNQGVNIGDISDSIKSTIITYIDGLAVGAPIILSQIIADVMQISGVASVTFTSPAPSTASITLNSNEKAIVTANNISIA